MRRQIILLLFLVLILAGCSRPIPGGLPTPTPTGQAFATLEATVLQGLVAPVTPIHTSTSFYAVQTGTPSRLPNFVRSELGCNWTGVTGQVFGQDGNPVTGLLVEVGGKLQDRDILSLALTGSSPDLGPGGFDITLADKALASQNTLFLQLFDLSGSSRSSIVSFSTSDSCDQNQVVINFREVFFTHIQHFPFMFKRAVPQGD